MLPVLSSSESRAFDEFLIKKVGLPSSTLMENAARGACNAISDWLSELGDRSVLIFCGKGNNGGDGLALARLLVEREVDVLVILTSPASALSKDALHQFNILKRLLPSDHILRFPFRDDHFLSHLEIGLVVDALLGTGSKGKLTKPLTEAVLAINGIAKFTGANVLSLDIPTGLNSDTGAVETVIGEKPVCVLADRTVAMGTLKTGFFQGFAPDLTGGLHVAQLGAPLPEHTSVSLLERKDVLPSVPKFFKTSTKHDRGFVLSIAGSRGMTGAAIMSGAAALRSGCGRVVVATSASERQIVASAMPELMTHALLDDEGIPNELSFNSLTELFAMADVVLAGPGIKNTNESNKLIKRLILETKKAIILDAGAFGAIAEDIRILKRRKSPTILTPHAGEMSRMLGITRNELESNRIRIATEFAETYNVVLVLKGAPTVIAMPSGNAYINSTGNPGMGTAGSGDVLSGMIAGLLAQEPEEPEQAAVLAVYLHGLCGDLAAETLSQHTMTATDLIDQLPFAFRKIQV